MGVDDGEKEQDPPIKPCSLHSFSGCMTLSAPAPGATCQHLQLSNSWGAYAYLGLQRTRAGRVTAQGNNTSHAAPASGHAGSSTSSTYSMPKEL